MVTKVVSVYKDIFRNAKEGNRNLILNQRKAKFPEKYCAFFPAKNAFH